MENLKVLVIDNSEHIRDFVIEYVLEPKGFIVDYAVDGRDGLEKTLAQKPDLLLLDYEMPNMTGLEVVEALRKQKNTVPIILMTSHGSEQVAVEFFRLGVQDYIRKPFTPDEMSDAIENALSLTYLKREKEALNQRLVQTNKQLEQHVQELSALYDVGKAISALMKPEQMLNRIVVAVLAVTKGEECVLVLVNPDTGEFAGQVKKRRETGSLLKAKKTEKVFSVPLRAGEIVVGTISITKAANIEALTSRDNYLLKMLADYAAIAIYNMHLMYQLQKTKEREKQQIRTLFERYVAPSVVKKVLAQPDQVELGGTRQEVAILFADIRGFSTFSTQVSPEILVKVLNQYFRVAAEAILLQEGTLDKFMGDAVMAFFNAPLAQADYPLRAVRAAWGVKQTVERLYTKLPEKYHLKFGIGVYVGQAVVGNIGTPQMMNFTVMGDSVNKAKRLQENSAGGQILINHQTRQLLKDDIQVKHVGDIVLKGQSQAEAVYQVLAVRPT